MPATPEAAKVALEQVQSILKDTLENADALDRKCAVCLSGVSAVLLGTSAYVPHLVSIDLLSSDITAKWLIFGILTTLFLGSANVLWIILLKAYRTTGYYPSGDELTGWEKEIDSSYYSGTELRIRLLTECRIMADENAETNAGRARYINRALQIITATLILVSAEVLVFLFLALDLAGTICN